MEVGPKTGLLLKTLRAELQHQHVLTNIVGIEGTACITRYCIPIWTTTHEHTMRAPAQLRRHSLSSPLAWKSVASAVGCRLNCDQSLDFYRELRLDGMWPAPTHR